MAVAAQRRWLRCGGSNGENIGAAMAIELQWQRWSRGSGNGATAAIFKRRIDRGGDNLAATAGITWWGMVLVAMRKFWVCVLTEKITVGM